MEYRVSLWFLQHFSIDMKWIFWYILYHQEHYLSHFQEDVRNLAPLRLLNTDLFESSHSEKNHIRKAKKCSINVLYTMMHNEELRNVYNLTGCVHKLNGALTIAKYYLPLHCNHKTFTNCYKCLFAFSHFFPFIIF